MEDSSNSQISGKFSHRSVKLRYKVLASFVCKISCMTKRHLVSWGFQFQFRTVGGKGLKNKSKEKNQLQASVGHNPAILLNSMVSYPKVVMTKLLNHLSIHFVIVDTLYAFREA